MKKKKVFVSAFGDKHNNLFRPGSNMRLNACVGRNGGPAGFDRYARGYFEAGERLAKSLQTDSSDVDIVIYPLVMVYRHGVETAIKHLCTIVPLLCDESADVKFTHKLMDNWKIVRGCLEELADEMGFERENLDRVDQIVKDLVDIDFNGEPFRYPEAKDGSLYLQETSIINVEVFAESMSEIGNFFEYLFFMVREVCHYRGEQLEEDARARQEMMEDWA